MSNKLEEKDWERLLQGIKDGKCTPIIGSGASSEKIPVSSQIASEWAKKYDYPMEDSDDLTRVAQFVAVIEEDKTAPKEKICKKIKELLKEVALSYFDIPDEPHGVLANLPLPVYITTNYDDFMVQALKSRGKTPNKEICQWYKYVKKCKRMSSDFVPTPEKPLVFHLHGSYEIPESLVLTEDDYLDFLAAISMEPNLLPLRIQEALTGTSFLFLGYRIADWDFHVLFRILARYLERSTGRKHLSVQIVPGDISEAQKEKAQKYLDRYFAEFNIQIYWQDCREFAAELKTRWEAFNRGTIEYTDRISRNLQPPVETTPYPENFEKWAIIVGISKYKDESLNLKYADRDAEELYKLLLTPVGGGFKEDHIKKLINEEATTAEITNALRSFLKKPCKDDIVILYFACHGSPDPDRPKNIYLLTHDTIFTNISGTALPMREIDLSLKEDLSAERVVIIADTCHSAAIGGGIGRRNVSKSAQEINAYLQAVSKAKGGVALLTSAEANESSQESEQWGDGHGVFTHFLLQGMRGDADGYGVQSKDGIVTVGELFEYVRDKVKEATDGMQHPAIGTNLFDRNLPITNLQGDEPMQN